MSNLEEIYFLSSVCEKTFQTNKALYVEYINWRDWFFDVEPAIGDWDEENAQPHLEQAASWMREFIEKNNLQ